MFISSNMTNREVFRLTGSLPEDRIEALIDLGEKTQAALAVGPYIDEAKGQFPAEDFLEDIKDRLITLSKRLRGDNRQTLDSIISALEDLAQEQFNASDYGRSELNNALKAIADLNK